MNLQSLSPGASAQYNRLIGREKQLLKEKRTTEALQMAAARDQLVPYLGDTVADTVKTMEILRPTPETLRDADKQGSLAAKVLGTLTWIGAVALGAGIAGEDGLCLGMVFGWIPAAVVGCTISNHVEAKRTGALRVESAARLANQLSEMPTTEVPTPTSEQIALGLNQLAQSYQQQGLTQTSNQLHAQAEWLLMNRPGSNVHKLFDEARHMHPLDDRADIIFEIVQRSADLPV